MKKMLLVILFLTFISLSSGNYSFWAVVDGWLTNDIVADFNMDGIVNLADFALIGSYGSDEYGLDGYGT